MKNEINRALWAKKKENEDPQHDWKTVLIEVILKILTLGFYHIEKHKQNR